MKKDTYFYRDRNKQASKHTFRISNVLALQPIFKCEISEFFQDISLPKIVG